MGGNLKQTYTDAFLLWGTSADFLHIVCKSEVKHSSKMI